jgi:hypothetical protein
MDCTGFVGVTLYIEPFALRPAPRCCNAVFWLREVSSRSGFLQGGCPSVTGKVKGMGEVVHEVSS